MASYLDTINKLYDIERKRINPYSAAKEVEAQQTSVVPQLQTTAESENTTGEKNKGGLIGGIGYLSEKLAAGLMQSVEGIWDFTAGGIADLLGEDAWAEEQVANDWFGDWYQTAGDWFNAGEGWKTAGDVASGIGTSVVPMASMFIPVPGVGAALGTAVRIGVSTASAVTAAGGTSLKEAYDKTGKIDSNEWGYAWQSGVTEGALETATNLLGLGGGALLKQFGKTAAKNMAKQATKAASMQGVKATLSTIGKTALEGFAGEAFEEGMSTILNPIYARATYDPEAKNATAQEIAYSALVGGLAGAVMGEGGLIASSALSAKSGGTLVAKNYQNEVLSFAEALIAEETKNPTDSAAMKIVNAKKAQLEKSLQENNGVWGMTQKKLLGDLNAAETEVVMEKAVVASALNLINNADAIATELSAYGYTDSNGNPIKITAEEIRAGISGKTKNIAIRKALEKNPLLRSLAAADAAGRLLMDTDSFAEQARSGKTLRTQDLLDQFIERASDEQKASLGHDLGINNWDGLRVEEFNYLVDKQYDTVGKQFKRARQKQQFEKLRGNKSIAVGKASAYRAKNDGIRKYKVNGHTFAVEKNGDEYTLYDYDNKGVSIELTLDELRKSLAIYDEAQAKLKQSAGKTADASEQAAEQNKASTAEKSSEKAQKEKTVTEKDTGESDNNVKKSFKLAKKVAGYDKLSAPDQRRVRSFIRQGLAFGVKEDVIIAGASISSRTRVEAIFNKAACAIIDENGNLTGYAHGFYNPRTKQFVFNPDAQTTDGILIHELDHAIRKRIGKGNFVTTKIYKGAIEKLNPDTFKKITEKYDKKHEQRGKVPETVTYLRRTSEQKLVDKLVEQKNQEEFAKTAETLIDEYEAHYAQQVLENKGIMEHLVAEKPALKDRILNFFKGAKTDYATVPALSDEAARYYTKYKKWFDSFAKSREGARIGAESEMGAAYSGATHADVDTDTRFALIGRTDDERGIYRTNYPENTPKDVKQKDIVYLVQNVWSKNPIKLNLIVDGKEVPIEARFNPELTERSDLSKIAFGNRKGTASEKRITMNLSSDLYQIAEESHHVGSKTESGKDNAAHAGVATWHYFLTDLVYIDADGTEIECYMNIDVKQNDSGHWFYSFAIEKGSRPADVLSVVTDKSATTSAISITENAEKSNPSDEKTSVNAKDSLGNELTEAQAEYFKDSKVRDKDGNLRAMYQGAQDEFTVFDRKKSKPSNLYGRGFYFTDSESHAALYGNYRKFYLDIKNPVSTTDKTITRMQMRKFLNAVAKNEDYSIENYGTYDVAEVLRSVYEGKSDFAMLYNVSLTAIGDLVEAVELFNEINGTEYDGFILDTETVTFRSNQAKLTSNKAPSYNPDIRMSLPIGNEDVSVEVEEEGDLLAIHNLTEPNLLDTLDLGGFPMPSIAVIRKGQEHSKYGNISVVFGRETIDPKTSPYNKIYGSDAWTPTYPKIEYKANPKVAKRIYDKYYELQSRYGYDDVRAMYPYAIEIEDRLNGRKGEENLLNELYDDTRMMQIYLMDIGKGRVETVKKEIRTEMTESEKEMNKFFVKELGENFINSFNYPKGQPIFSYRIEFVTNNEEQIKNTFKKYLVDVLGIEPDLVDNVLDAQRKSDYAKMLRDAYRYLHEGTVSVKTEDDIQATEEAIRKTADNEQYRQWVDSLFKGVQEKSGIRNSRDYYDRYGNSRSWEQLHYENTIDNVIRVMREDVETGMPTLFSGNSIWGVAAKKYKSIDDVKDDKQRLKTLPEEEYKNLSGELGGRLSAIAETIKSDSESNPFIAKDNALQLIVDCVRTCKTKPAMVKYLKRYSSKATVKTVDDIIALVRDIANMPTGYFEAKPRRAVDFSEIKMVELPESASDTLKEKLADRKIPFEVYGSTDMERFNAIQNLQGVSFSLPLDEQYVDKSVPYVGEDNLSVGEMRKRIANSTHYKVYSKSRVLNTIKSLPVINSLNGKTVGTLADAMWKSFNTITSTEQADAYVSDMADYIMSVAMSDAKTKRNIPEDSQRRFNMMRGYVQKLVFTEKELDEIKTVRGEKELKRILGRWGYKAKNDANGMKSIKTPVDVFVADISREMSEFSYIEDMNPIDAFFALDEAYTEAKNDVSDKWQSIFEDVSDEDIDSIRYALKDDLMNAFKNAGDKSNYKKILENTVERYKDRADYWKAEYDKENGRSRLTNIVAAKARKLKDLKVHRFANATQFENDTLDAVIAKLARVVINGNLSVKTAKSACEELLMLYRSSTFREGVLEFYDENNQGYYNELIETYLEILVGEENHLSIEDYVEKGDQYYKGYTKQQLKMLADVMSYFTSLYENYGKVWKKGKLVEAMPLAKQYITGIRETKAIYGERIGNRLTNWYRDTFFDPISVMRRIDGYDEGFFTDIYGEFRRGIIDASVAIMDIFREYDGWLNSHKKYLANASETAVEFMGHEIPRIKLIDLYCTTKRKQAQAGLAINGFAYDNLKGLVVRVDGKLDKDGKYTEEQIQEVITGMQTEIEKHLTAEDREYIALIEKVYNGEAKRLKTMRDFARQGFTNAEADYYYPIRRAYIKKSVDSATMKEEIDRVSNASFNKDVVKGAKQELTVESADSRFRRHVQAVCQYAYLSPAVDTFNRLYNLDTAGNKGRKISISTESENLWRNGMMYFEKLVADIQGINERTEGSEVLSFLRGGYAISVLSVNPKVWVTQLSSFAAASGMIDNDCLIKGVRTATKEDVENIGRYCPLAELRRYDNTAAMAQAVVDNRGVQRGSGSKSVQAMRKLGEAGMKPIEKVDSMVINRLFGACMRQVEKDQGIKIRTEENKIAAGKLLETLILETQQNALATERSAAMRSNNEIFRAATMFSADAMKVVCRFVDATGEARALKARIKNAADAETKTALESRLNEAHKKVRKSLGALIASSAYMAGVTALFKLLYNKWDKEWEEDESKAYSVISSITLDFIGNNFGGLPLIRDVISKLTEGYDIDNYAYSAINDIVQAFQNFSKLVTEDSSEEDVANAIKNLVYATSSFTGLPARNVYNVVYGLTKRVSEPAAYKIDEVFYEKNYASDLQKYIDEGDVTMSDFIIDLIYDTRAGGTVKESTMNKIRNIANKGYKVLPREIKETVTVDGNEYTLTEKEQEDVREKYFDYLSALDRLCEGAMYSSLDEEKKYQAIKNVIDIGYEKALSDILGTECSRGTLLSYCIGVESFAALKSVVKDYENDVDKKGNVIEGSKREKVVKAIRSMPATATQKVLMMYALGYTPKDNELGMSKESAKNRLLSSIVSATNLTKMQKEQLAKACGFTVKNGKIVP